MAVALVMVSLFLMPVQCDLAAHPHSVHVAPATVDDAHHEHAPAARHGTERTYPARDALTVSQDDVATGDMVRILTAPNGEPFMTNAQTVIDREAISSGGIVVTLPSLADILAFPDDGNRTPLPTHGKPVGVTSPPDFPPPKS